MQADRASNWFSGDGGDGGGVGRALHLAGQEGHQACPYNQPLFCQLTNKYNSPMTLPRTMLSQGVMKNWTPHEIIQNKKASSGKIGKTLFKWIDQLCLWISVLIICLSTQITTTW